MILRRLKSEVAKDLPEKIEQIVFCDLKPTQREVYTKLLQESKTSLLEADGAAGARGASAACSAHLSAV